MNSAPFHLITKTEINNQLNDSNITTIQHIQDSVDHGGGGGVRFTFKYCIVQNLHLDLSFPSMPSKCNNAVDNRQMFHPCFGLISTENTTFESIVVGRIG